MPSDFTIAAVIQSGRLQYEAVLFLLSLRQYAPDFTGKIVFLEPQHTEKWSHDPRVSDPEIRALIEDHGAQIVPFENHYFGEWYPNANKIEGLSALNAEENFVFFDTDTLFTGDITQIDFDFSRPSASMKREGTWPHPPLYGPGYHGIWKSLYDKFGLPFEGTLDLSQPDEHWERYLYFNAGWFFYKDPAEFHRRYYAYATKIFEEQPDELACQELFPWLDQIALPLVIHGLGGGRHTIPDGLLDGSVSCHYRFLPLLYARESEAAIQALETITAPNKIKKVIKSYEPIRKMVYHGHGKRVREMFDQNALPLAEQAIRNKIKKAGYWYR